MAPRVDFHILKKEQEKVYLYLARLVEKAYGLKNSILIYTNSAEEAELIDDLLWEFQETSFLPHDIWNPQGTSRAPIIITYTDTPFSEEVLINLTPHIPKHFAQFQRIVELVTQNEEIAASGRNKYREYQKQNCVINTFHIN